MGIQQPRVKGQGRVAAVLVLRMETQLNTHEIISDILVSSSSSIPSSGSISNSSLDSLSIAIKIFSSSARQRGWDILPNHTHLP